MTLFLNFYNNIKNVLHLWYVRLVSRGGYWYALKSVSAREGAPKNFTP